MCKHNAITTKPPWPVTGVGVRAEGVLGKFGWVGMERPPPLPRWEWVILMGLNHQRRRKEFFFHVLPLGQGGWFSAQHPPPMIVGFGFLGFPQNLGGWVSEFTPPPEGFAPPTPPHPTHSPSLDKYNPDSGQTRRGGDERRDGDQVLDLRPTSEWVRGP